MAAKAEIDVQLVRLIATSKDHFGMAPDDVRWGHVTTQQGTPAALHALHA